MAKHAKEITIYTQLPSSVQGSRKYVLNYNCSNQFLGLKKYVDDLEINCFGERKLKNNNTVNVIV